MRRGDIRTALEQPSPEERESLRSISTSCQISELDPDFLGAVIREQRRTINQHLQGLGVFEFRALCGL